MCDGFNTERNSRLASLDYGVDIMFSSILATVAGMFSNGPAVCVCVTYLLRMKY